MAIPFKIFEHGKLDNGYNRAGYIWCVRCEDWIPFEEAFGFGTGFDPHIYDHVTVYEALQRVDRIVPRDNH